MRSDEVALWLTPPPFLFRLARWWYVQGWRGKGAIPRLIGRVFCASMKTAIRTRSGLLLAVDPQHLDMYCVISAQGAWDKHVLDQLLNNVRQGDVVYDIGANTGNYALEVAAALGDQVTVYAFEPQPSLADAIRISAELNGFRSVEVNEIALCDRVGDATIFVPSHGIHASLVPREDGATAIHCRAETIDNLVSTRRLRPPTVIKVDVEGAEMAVLQGGRDTIARHRPVILFEADENCRRFGYSPSDLCAFVQDLADYEIRFIDERSEALGPLHDPCSRDMPEGDYLALPKRLSQALSLLIFGWHAALERLAEWDAVSDCIIACIP